MKKFYLPLVLSLFFITSYGQVTIGSPDWNTIGDTTLSIVSDDADNTDGTNDGAIFVDGQSAVVGQGASCTFSGTMLLNETLNIKTYVYNSGSSYVRLKVELVNVTDNTILVASSPFSMTGGSAPVLTTLNYTAVASDVNDTFQVRYVRTDNGHTARNFAIDNLSFNNTFVSISLANSCPFTLTPDLSLIASNATIENEITTAVNRFSDDYLGTSAPSSAALASAESAYNALNITANSGAISGNTIASFNTVSFLKTFAQHLKFNPSDVAIKEKALNTVWLTSKQFCSGVLPRDPQKYAYANFARPASLLKDYLTQEVKDLFAYTLYKHSHDFGHFWEANYDAPYQTANGSIDTDLIYNISDAMLAYSLWHDSADERYRYMRGFNRFINRFFSHTVGTTDGIKKDGSGFHHWNGYSNYMYAYNTAANLISYLDGTSFQIGSDNYKTFRDAVYLQYMLANDYGVQPLATGGRNPHIRKRQFSKASLKKLALAGKSILNIPTADPLLAGIYNRIYGVDAEFNYSGVTPLSNHEGNFQNNHSHTNIFRKDNWVAVSKGFSNYMWGSEIYISQNRYGRYQSYGTLEIIYPGTLTDNGFDINTSNWNYNPGATTIVLPWDKLHAERGRIDEFQEKRFVGALTFKNKNSTLLKAFHGTSGIFAMDFKEKEGLGWGTVHSSNNHNATFTFKKSTFTFDDFIVCLASDINNDDASNPTVTTLYQRKNSNSNNVIVNNATQNGTASYSDTSDNWVISKYNTGFYIVANGVDLNVWDGNQQVPNQNQTHQNISGNPTGSYSIGYINHGTNPNNEGYEYMVLPNTNASAMLALGNDISSGNKPYIVHQKDANAHIIEHVSKKTWGYSVFNDNTTIANTGLISHVDKSGLVMYETNTTIDQITMAVSNPDIGFLAKSFTPAVEKKIRITIKGDWSLQGANPDIVIVSNNSVNTVIEFTTNHGLPVEASFSKNISIPAPQNLTATNTTKTTTDLSWDASIGATNYDVYQGASVIANISNTSYQVTGLTANTAYTFSIKAKDDANNISESSNTVSITTLNQFDYCASASTDVSHEYIGRFQLHTIDNTSGGQLYSDFTNISTHLTKGDQYTVTITPIWTGTAYGEAYAVWIDLNIDGDFNDSGEKVWSKSRTFDTSVSGTFTIPSVATTGSTRMRVSMKFNTEPLACETFEYGEVEDYTINIQNSVASKASIKEPNMQLNNDNNKTENSFVIYPNPAKGDLLYMKSYQEQNNMVSYKIVNFLGQTVSKGTLKRNTIDISKLSSGNYIIRLYNSKNIIAIKKFIRQ
jgi:hypothetical protein